MLFPALSFSQSNWKILDISDNECKYYYDSATIQHKTDYSEVWMKLNYFKGDSAFIRIDYYCKTRKSITVEKIEYMRNGRVETKQYPFGYKIKSVIQSSADEDIFNEVCKQRHYYIK